MLPDPRRTWHVMTVFFIALIRLSLCTNRTELCIRRQHSLIIGRSGVHLSRLGSNSLRSLWQCTDPRANNLQHLPLCCEMPKIKAPIPSMEIFIPILESKLNTFLWTPIHYSLAPIHLECYILVPTMCYNDCCLLWNDMLCVKKKGARYKGCKHQRSGFLGIIELPRRWSGDGPMWQFSTDMGLDWSAIHVSARLDSTSEQTFLFFLLYFLIISQHTFSCCCA
jgi:hypothetical protein